MNAPLPESVRKALETVTLDDKYALETGRAFMSGVQALVRLPMLQRLRDGKNGLNTAGFVSGYRGSNTSMPRTSYGTSGREFDEPVSRTTAPAGRGYDDRTPRS